MMGFVNLFAEAADEELVRRDFARHETKQAQEFSRHENREAHIDEVDGTEDCAPRGRSSRAADAFQRAKQ